MCNQDDTPVETTKRAPRRAVRAISTPAGIIQARSRLFIALRAGKIEAPAALAQARIINDQEKALNSNIRAEIKNLEVQIAALEQGGRG